MCVESIASTPDQIVEGWRLSPLHKDGDTIEVTVRVRVATEQDKRQGTPAAQWLRVSELWKQHPHYKPCQPRYANMPRCDGFKPFKVPRSLVFGNYLRGEQHVDCASKALVEEYFAEKFGGRQGEFDEDQFHEDHIGTLCCGGCALPLEFGLTVVGCRQCTLVVCECCYEKEAAVFCPVKSCGGRCFAEKNKQRAEKKQCANPSCSPLGGCFSGVPSTALPSGQAASKGCAKCKRVKYCSRDCQRAHWKTHKRVCAPQQPRYEQPSVELVGEARLYEEGECTVVRKTQYERTGGISFPMSCGRVTSDAVKRQSGNLNRGRGTDEGCDGQGKYQVSGIHVQSV
jgi:hypothetical protein